MDSASMVAVPNEPPDMTFISPRMLVLAALKYACSAVVLMNGTGILLPSRKMTKMNATYRSFFRSSGTFHALRMVSIN